MRHPGSRGVVAATLFDAERRGVGRGAAVALLLAPLALGAVLLWALTDHERYRAVLAEDHVFEWAQFTCYAVAGVAGLVVCRALARTRHRWSTAAWGVYGAATLFVAGDEIAWGQRIFGFSTPDALDSVNRQNEVTVHNIASVNAAASAALLLVALGGSVGVVALACWAPCRLRRPLALVTPPPVLVPLFFVPVPLKAVRVLQALVDGRSGSDVPEYGELCLALALAAFAVVTARELRAAGPGVTAVVELEDVIDLEAGATDLDRPPTLRHRG